MANQRRRALGIGRGEHRTDGKALLEPEERRTLRFGSVHDGVNVVHAGLERQLLLPRNDVVGETGPPSIENDQTREASEALVEPGHLGPVPAQFDVGHEPRDENEVAWAAADDLVGDVNAIGRLRIAGLGRAHARVLRLSKFGESTVSGTQT